MDPEEDAFLPPLQPSEAPIDPDVEAFIESLNPAQKTAVTTPAKVLQILAPPGSGKTRTLTARVASLLSPPYNLPPSTVIVATFTVKASREMRDRIVTLIGEERARGLILGTFHSICRRWLCIYGELVGVKKGFGIADSADSLAIVKRCLKRVKGAGGDGKVDAGQVRNKISNYKARSCERGLSMVARKKEGKEFAEVFDLYEETLKTQGLLDYDDLLIMCVELLRKYPETGQKIRAVLVDEFQDTNVVQWELVRLFSDSSKRVTVVGDPDQSIYGFRAAEVGNLGRMAKWFPGTEVVCLSENYRSAGAILVAAEEVITQDKQRPEKPLVATHGFGVRPVLRKLPTAPIEGQWMVGEIKRIVALTAGRVTLDDVAILVRSASLTRSIESALGRAGMAYRMVGGSRFFDRIEVKLILDYLRVVYNPNNSDALSRIIGVPPRRVGELTIRSLLEEAEKKGKTLWVFIREGLYGGFKGCTTKLQKTAEQGLSSLVGIIMGARKFLEVDPDDTAADPTIPDIIDYILRKLNYEEYLTTKYPQDHETRWANVQEITAQAIEFASTWSPEFDEYNEESNLLNDVSPAIRLTTCLADFLANVALASERLEDSEGGSQPRITISTIHASKGLEWPIVFIPAVYAGSIPHSRSEDHDEERRLLYVAMTRAQAMLYLSYPTYNTFDSEAKLSPFLTPPKIQKMILRCGPRLTRTEVTSLLTILNRTTNLPTPDEITTATKSLDTLLDDVYPLDPDELDDARARKRAYASEDPADDDRADLDDIIIRPHQPYKPPGFSNNFTTAATTIMTGMSLTNTGVLTTTTMSAFQSANVHLATYHGRAEKDLETPAYKKPSKMAKPHPKGSRFGDTIIDPTPKGKEPKAALSCKNDKAQPSVLSFFAKPTPPAPVATASPSQPRNLSWEKQSKQQSKPKVAGSKTPVLPGMKTPERPKFVLLSSSPAGPPPEMPGFGKVQVHADQVGGDGDRSVVADEQVPGVAGGGEAKKRRLGVGGKMAGWGERKRKF